MVLSEEARVRLAPSKVRVSATSAKVTESALSERVTPAFSDPEPETPT